MGFYYSSYLDGFLYIFAQEGLAEIEKRLTFRKVHYLATARPHIIVGSLQTRLQQTTSSIIEQ